MLDLACGGGRHAQFFAARGHPVLAVDRDAAALAALRGCPGIEARVGDLEAGNWPLAGEHFAGIVVTHYLHRPRLPELVAGLAPDGVLIYETFAAGNAAFGRPANPAFLLCPGELFDLAAAHGLTVVAFEQGRVAQHGAGPAVIERIAAVGRGRAWPPQLPVASAASAG